ncbi:hypothetical protein Tco_1238126 [Tanacetum coccineum]
MRFNYNRSASAAAHSAWERLRPLAADSVATIPEPETIKVIRIDPDFCGPERLVGIKLAGTPFQDDSCPRICRTGY